MYIISLYTYIYTYICTRYCCILYNKQRRSPVNVCRKPQSTTMGPCLIAPIGKNTTDHLQREHEQNISSSSRTGRATQVSPALI